MRDRKYRAWDKHNKVWAGPYTLEQLADDDQFSYDREVHAICSKWECFEWVESIGRKDRKGDDVYDGDIIKTGPAKVWVIGEPFVGRVYWNESEFQWWITDDTKDPVTGIDYDLTFLNNYQYFEVIGHIYETPDLLKK
jgi:hypothetical protein